MSGADIVVNGTISTEPPIFSRPKWLAALPLLSRSAGLDAARSENISSIVRFTVSDMLFSSLAPLRQPVF
jgi:hypothetical protein